MCPQDDDGELNIYEEIEFHLEKLTNYSNTNCVIARLSSSPFASMLIVAIAIGLMFQLDWHLFQFERTNFKRFQAPLLVT